MTRLSFALSLVVIAACGTKPQPSATKGASAAGTTSTAAVAASSNGAGVCPSDMVAVPAGKFALASTKKDATIAAHCLDRTEVTVAAYGPCVQSGKCTAPDANDGDKHQACNWKRDGASDHPINCLDQAQAATFCATLGKRLPTEEEWEWSARGGAIGSTFPWGEAELNGHACWDDDALPESPTGTCPVGKFPDGATPSGIVDLSGNVWEWTSTPWKEGSPDVVDRGGGWLNGATNMLTAGFRNHLPKNSRYASLGFRCAR